MDSVLKPTKARTGGKKSKSKGKRPARNKYWMSRTLEKRKVRNLMKYCGMTKEKALEFWHKNRKGRVRDGYLQKSA